LVETNSAHDLKNDNANTGKMIMVTKREIARLEIIVTGMALIYSPIIPLNPKYKGTNTIIVVKVPKIIALE
jgi:hypothetical protein